MIEALSDSVSFYLKECSSDPVWGVHHSGTLHPRHARCVVCLVVKKDHVLKGVVDHVFDNIVVTP